MLKRHINLYRRMAKRMAQDYPNRAELRFQLMQKGWEQGLPYDAQVLDQAVDRALNPELYQRTPEGYNWR